MEKVHLTSLGCPKNLVDSELMLGALTQAGYEVTSDPSRAHVLIVNTCSFIEAAKKESIDAILSAAQFKRAGRGRRLVVAGCLSQRYTDELRRELPEVDILVGTGNFLELPAMLGRAKGARASTAQRNGANSGPNVTFYPGAAHLLPQAQLPRLRSGLRHSAYLKVSEGCDHRCAFCIIPKIRGRHESRPPADIVAEARRLAEDGCREINLVAQDLTAYGRDLRPGSSLAALLEQLARIDGVRWIRLLYCYPNFVTNELLDAIAALEPVVKYIDMPLQHADDGVLRAMRRERNVAAVERLLDRVRGRVDEVVIRTAFIVGFPGETDEAFERLLQFVRTQQFDRVGVFTYSHEEGTAAYDLPGQVPKRVKRARRARLMEAQAPIALAKNRALVGREIEVLVDERTQPGTQRFCGRSAGQAPEIDGMVILEGEANPGEFVRAQVTRASNYDLYAKVIQRID